LAAEIEAAFPGAEIDLRGGSRGVFTVIADGRVVWNKHEAGRFPNPGEVVGLVREG
jgi:selT/selW/selH-like putative selenoprotein